MAEGKEKEKEQPREQVIATVHLPLDMGDYVAILQSLAERFPNAILRNEDGDPTRTSVVVPERSAEETSSNDGLDARAQQMLEEILGGEKFSGMIDVAETEGMLTTDEAADLRRLASEAETFLGFGGARA